MATHEIKTTEVKQFLFKYGPIIVSGLLVLFSGEIYNSLDFASQLSSDPSFLNKLASFFLETQSSAIVRSHPDSVMPAQLIEYTLKVNLLIFLGSVSLPKLLELVGQNQKIVEGKARYPKRKSPDVAVLGDSDLVGDFIPEKMDKERVIVIHPDSNTPACLGDTTCRHFKAQPKEIIGTASQVNGKETFFDFSGLGRVKEIVAVCVNPENAVFYRDSQPAISIDQISTIINSLPVDKDGHTLYLRTLKVISNSGSYIAGYKIDQLAEIKSLCQKKNIKLIEICPETELITRLKGTEDNRLIPNNQDVIIVGDQSDQIEASMLIRFSSTVSKELRTKSVTIVDSHSLEETQLTDLKPDFNDKWIIVYCTSDTLTTSVARAIATLNVPLDRIIPIIESPIMKTDSAQFENTVFVNQLVQTRSNT